MNDTLLPAESKANGHPTLAPAAAWPLSAGLIFLSSPRFKSIKESLTTVAIGFENTITSINFHGSYVSGLMQPSPQSQLAHLFLRATARSRQSSTPKFEGKNRSDLKRSRVGKQQPPSKRQKKCQVFRFLDLPGGMCNIHHGLHSALTVFRTTESHLWVRSRRD